MHENPEAISYQERWNGRTEFRNVEFDAGQLRFEFDIAEWRSGGGPIAVEPGRLENKGVIRFDAQLDGNRLIGKWRMFTGDRSEVFRGEWEATRSNESPSP